MVNAVAIIRNTDKLERENVVSIMENVIAIAFR